MSNVIRTSKKSTIMADVFLPKMTLTLTFINGKEIVVDANTLSQEIRDQALLHGLKQKLVDAAAISRNLDTGASASVDDKYNAVRKIADRLMRVDAKWNEGRATNADAPATAGVNNILLRALMQMTGRDLEYTKAFLEGKTKEQRASLRKNPRVMAIMAELSAATVVNGVNTDDLLTELGMELPEEIVADAIDTTPLPPVPPFPVPPKLAKAPNTRTSKKKLVTVTE
jgi:hypothetical protein